MEIKKVTPETSVELANFFRVITEAGEEVFFRPHPLSAFEAERIARYKGQDLYYVAVDNNVVLAYGLLRGWDEGYEIPSLGVATLPSLRGTPLARAMMMFLHAAAASKGSTSIRLRVAVNNHPAISLYRKLGYKFQNDSDPLLVGRLDLHPDIDKIPWARPVLFGDERKAAVEAIDSTFLSDGPFIHKFEKAFSELHSYPPDSSLLVSSGTTALHLALLALGIGPGDEVIVPGFGFGAAANMAIACGAVPILADVLEDEWTLDYIDVCKKLTARTKAVVAIHTYGNMVDIDALRSIVPPTVAIIEDCAESLFSSSKGRLCGSLGDIGVYSFQSTKTIACGEGGLIMAKNPELLERMRLYRSHGMTTKRKYWHEVPGHNFRLTNIQAAVLCAQFGHREELCSMRDVMYAGYRRKLGAMIGNQDLQVIPSEVKPVMWALGVRVSAKKRQTIMNDMALLNIETRPGFHALSEQLLYGSHSNLNTPVANRIANEIICLPAPADISEAELDRVCDSFVASVTAKK